MLPSHPSHYCELGSNLGPGITCGLSSLLVLVLAPRSFSGCSSFPLSAKYHHSKCQFDLAKVDRKSHPMDCPLLKSSYLIFCVPPSKHALPCLGLVTIYYLGGVGGFLLYHTEISLVPPPPNLCSILMIPLIGS